MTPPKSITPSASSEGPLRGAAPNSALAEFWKMMPSAIVEMNTDTGGRDLSGKYARPEKTKPPSAIAQITIASTATPGRLVALVTASAT